MYVYMCVPTWHTHTKAIALNIKTFASQEKFPFLIEMAGSPGSWGGFGRRILSSAKSSSSKRFKDTFALTTCQSNATLEAEKQYNNLS